MADSGAGDEVRRRDRARDDAWIRAFLRRASFGFMATVAEGRPFLNSNLFVYVEPSAIYLHTARTGRTPFNVAQEGPVTFSAAVLGRLLPAPTALEFSSEYSAVVVFGTVHPVTDEAEKRLALEQVMEKYAPHLHPGADYHPITEAELRRTAVHRIDVESWNGKEKVVPADFPGAFLPPVLIPGLVGQDHPNP